MHQQAEITGQQPTSYEAHWEFVSYGSAQTSRRSCWGLQVVFSLNRARCILTRYRGFKCYTPCANETYQIMSAISWQLPMAWLAALECKLGRQWLGCQWAISELTMVGSPIDFIGFMMILTCLVRLEWSIWCWDRHMTRFAKYILFSRFMTN